MKLIPPNITTGPWTAVGNEIYQNGSPELRKLEKFIVCRFDVTSYREYPTIQEADRNAEFIAAAPAMAEALEVVWDHYASIDDLSRAEERAFRKVEDCLLSAGYTLATDPE
jgi:hypothetical protein